MVLLVRKDEAKFLELSFNKKLFVAGTRGRKRARSASKARIAILGSTGMTGWQYSKERCRLKKYNTT